MSVPKSDWRRIVAVGIVAIVCTGIGWIIWPTQPTLEAYHYEHARDDAYRAGGRKCEPATLAAIRPRRKAASQTENCAKEAEDYRLQTNDLIQQTRAADAAQAQAWLAYQSSWNGFFQTLGGLLTLIAAGLAAKYARDAATETKRGASAAEDANRPWIKIIFDKCESMTFDNGRVSLICPIIVENFGSSPALNLVPIGKIHLDPMRDHQRIAGLVPIDGFESGMGKASAFVSQIIKNISIHDTRLGDNIFPGEKRPYRLRVDTDTEGATDVIKAGVSDAIINAAIGVRYRYGENRAVTIEEYSVAFLDSDSMYVFLRHDGQVAGDLLTLFDTYGGKAT